MKLLVDCSKTFEKSTKIKCKLDYIQKVYKTRLMASVIKEKIESVLSQMAENIPYNNCFYNIPSSNLNTNIKTCPGNFTSSGAMNLTGSASDYSMYLRPKHLYMPLNILNLPYKLYLRHSSIQNSQFLSNFIQSAVMKSQYYHRERDDNYGNPRKRKGKILPLKITS